MAPSLDDILEAGDHVQEDPTNHHHGLNGGREGQDKDAGETSKDVDSLRHAVKITGESPVPGQTTDNI